ncbi:MAG: hypothetical protein SGI90_13825 [Candidatus Eisenbacteria bacterium]|nr:hypothetical protein [Candidatus Eisenbacteria bacterium]
MNAAHALKSLALAMLLALASTGVIGCGEDKDSDDVTEVGLIRVNGTVTLLNDQTPVDGGVTIQVTDPQRGNVTLWFESLFTNPPPTPDRLAVYQDIQKVSVGNQITATARADGATNLHLESIKVILNR